VTTGLRGGSVSWYDYLMTNTMENVIRALVAYGDTVNRTALSLVMGMDNDDDAQAMTAKEIVTEITGYVVTDSTIDDLTDAIDDEDDMFNE
jgi:hypothetical protein